MAIVSFLSFVDSSYRGIVERQVQCAQSPMHRVQIDSSRLHSSMKLEAEINEQLQFLFATTLPLKLRHSDVTVL